MKSSRRRWSSTFSYVKSTNYNLLLTGSELPSFSLFFIGHAHANCLNALFLAILRCSIYNWITSCYPLIFNWLYRLRNVYKFSPRRNSIYAARTLKVLTFKRILESAHDLADEDNAFHFDLSEAWSLRKRKAFKISDIGRRIWKARRNRSGRRINLKWNFFKTTLFFFFRFHFPPFRHSLRDIFSNLHIFSPRFHSVIGYE